MVSLRSAYTVRVSACAERVPSTSARPAGVRSYPSTRCRPIPARGAPTPVLSAAVRNPAARARIAA